MHSPDISLFFILHSPAEVPSPNEWFTHNLSWIIPHEPHIPIYPLEIMPQF